MPFLTYPNSDWRQSYGDDASLVRDLLVSPTKGWHKKGGDTLLVLKRDGGGWAVWCWNGSDPREILTELLRLPERTYPTGTTNVE